MSLIPKGLLCNSPFLGVTNISSSDRYSDIQDQISPHKLYIVPYNIYSLSLKIEYAVHTTCALDQVKTLLIRPISLPFPVHV